MGIIESWKSQARQLKKEIYALYLAHRDPRVPWYVRLFIACVVAYALSPIDLIPDPIPVLGHLDDLVLIPLGIALAIKMIPPVVLAECREAATAVLAECTRTNWFAAIVIICTWLFLATLAIRLWMRLTDG